MDKATFVDGLGRRLSLRSPDGQLLESLRLSSQMEGGPEVEAALVERATAVSDFEHEALARFCRIERVSGINGGLAVLSAQVEGPRLSEVLRHAERRVIDPDPEAVWSIVQQLVSVVAALHRHGSDVSHGAIAPERTVVRPDGSVVLVEHVLGSALEHLQLPRSQLWTLFHVAVPPTAGPPRLDQQADVLQVGMLALAMLLGRMIRRDEFPSRVADLLGDVAAPGPAGGHRRGLPRPLHSWLARALQLDPRCAFRTGTEAEDVLSAALAEAECKPSRAAVAQYIARASGEVALALPVAPVVPPPPASTPARRVERRNSSGAQVMIPPKTWSPLERAARLGIVVIGLVLLWGVTYLGARAYLRLPPSAPPTGILSVESRPTGLPLTVDGQPRGRTPLTLELSAGGHTLSVQTSRGTTTMPVTVAAGARRLERIEVRAHPGRPGERSRSKAPKN